MSRGRRCILETDLIDKWPKTVRRRNREPVPFVAKHMIMTSSLMTYDCYRGVLEKYESIEQLLWRITIIKMDERYSKGNTGP